MRYLIVALAAVTICTVSAQTAPKKGATKPAPSASSAPVIPPPAVEPAWEKEPEAFLGIKFNEPFGVISCPTKRYSQYSTSESTDYEALKSIDGVCVDSTEPLYKYQKPESATYKLLHLPVLGIGYNVSVHLKNGVVSKITIDLKHSSFGVLLTAFKDRYGMPTSVENNTVKTNAGAEFSAADVTWKGKKISIGMYERLGKVDDSYVVISDNAIMEAEMAATRAKRAAEAQKF